MVMPNKCNNCRSPINNEDTESYCIAPLKDEDERWVTDRLGNKLLVCLCLPCGKKIGAKTAKQLFTRARAFEEEERRNARMKAFGQIIAPRREQ